jgi:hypothetical protein
MDLMSALMAVNQGQDPVEQWSPEQSLNFGYVPSPNSNQGYDPLSRHYGVDPGDRSFTTDYGPSVTIVPSPPPLPEISIPYFYFDYGQSNGWLWF